jgi:hypothetical protein
VLVLESLSPSCVAASFGSSELIALLTGVQLESVAITSATMGKLAGVRRIEVARLASRLKSVVQ